MFLKYWRNSEVDVEPRKKASKMQIDEGPVKRECQNYRSRSSCHYFFLF